MFGSVVYDAHIKLLKGLKFIFRKTAEKGMKEANIYEDYAVRGEDTYSIKISPVEVE